MDMEATEQTANLAESQHRMVVDPKTGQYFAVPISALVDPTVIPVETISISKASCLLRCAKQFEYQYVLKVPRKKPVAMVVGSTMHSALAAFFSSLLPGNDPLAGDEVFDFFASEWKASCKKDDIEWNPKGEDDVRKPDQWQDLIIRLLADYLQTQAPGIVPILVEEPFAFPLPGTHYHVTGRIDLETADHRLVDFKFAKKAKSQNEADKDLQATAYALRYFMSDRRRSRPVTFEFHVAVDRAKPGWNPISTERDLTDVAMFYDLVRAVILQLESGVFTPNPTSFMCGPGVCSYYDQCRGESARKFYSLDGGREKES
jgi:hypothetical protein